VKFWTTDPTIPDRISLISQRTWNGGSGQECRVVIEGGRARSWTAVGSRVIPTDDAEVLAIERFGTGWKVTTDGGVWDVAQGGCGCGSPLRSWDPKGADVG